MGGNRGVADTVGLGHVDDGLSIAIGFVVIGCGMVEVWAQVHVSPDQEADLIVNERESAVSGSVFVFSSSENLVVVLAGMERPG